MKKLKILALLTNRKSNNNQVLTLSNLLADNGEIYKKTIFFNSFIKIPNRISQFFIPIWMLIKKSDSFFDIEDCDIIITAGRQATRYAIHLKKTMYKNAKIIQIMNPDMSSKYIDLLLLPSHDIRHIERYKEKVITYHGSIFNKFQEDTEENLDRFKTLIPNCKKPYISVFIGGSSKNYKFTKESTNQFIEIIKNLSKNMNASLLITTSRRTDPKIIKSIQSKIDLNENYFYKFGPKNEFNPMLPMVHFGDYFIVTGDSISMINELMNSCKPLYIFTNGINAKKYKHFYQSAVNIGKAKIITENLNKLEEFSTNCLNDFQDIKNKITAFLRLK